MIIQRQLRRPLIPALVLMLLSACATLGILTPQTFDERLSYAYEQHTAALQTITTAANHRLITKREGQAILSIADQSRLLLDAARVAQTGGDISSAEGRLVLALNVLREIQTYLRTRTVIHGGDST